MSVKGQLANSFSFTVCISSVAITQLCHGHAIAATDNTNLDEQGQLSIKLYLKTIELKFHIVFVYRETLFLLISFQTFKNVKPGCTKTGSGSDLAQGPWFAVSCAKPQTSQQGGRPVIPS